MKSVDFVRKIK